MARKTYHHKSKEEFIEELAHIAAKGLAPLATDGGKVRWASPNPNKDFLGAVVDVEVPYWFTAISFLQQLRVVGDANDLSDTYVSLYY